MRRVGVDPDAVLLRLPLAHRLPRRRRPGAARQVRQFPPSSARVLRQRRWSLARATGAAARRGRLAAARLSLRPGAERGRTDRRAAAAAARGADRSAVPLRPEYAESTQASAAGLPDRAARRTVRRSGRGRSAAAAAPAERSAAGACAAASAGSRCRPAAWHAGRARSPRAASELAGVSTAQCHDAVVLATSATRSSAADGAVEPPDGVRSPRHCSIEPIITLNVVSAGTRLALPMLALHSDRAARVRCSSSSTRASSMARRACCRW